MSTLSASFEYVELNDAAKCPTVRASTQALLRPASSPVEQSNRIEVWFAKNLRDAEDFPVNLVHRDEGTHVLLGCVEWRRDWQSLFGALQGDFWSPRGEARQLIKRLGLSHTSMSVGDILVCFNPDDSVEVWMCVSTGWRQLGHRDMLCHSALSMKTETDAPRAKCTCPPCEDKKCCRRGADGWLTCDNCGGRVG